MKFVWIIIVLNAIFLTESVAIELSSKNEKLFPDLGDRSALSAGKSSFSFPLPGARNSRAVYEPKSVRRAFFLSFLLPGLGETYVGSSRGLFFFGLEAASWYIYSSRTKEGERLERAFQAFANRNWNYDTTISSTGDPLDNNYWNWVKYYLEDHFGGDPNFVLPDPHDYAVVDSLMMIVTGPGSNSDISGFSIHNLPAVPDQQYYEMIGKYPQFVYGWEDIGDPEINPGIRNGEGDLQYIDIRNVHSPLRMQYEDMRHDSNIQLKKGETGLQMLLLNRVFSAVHAARLAYHHNERLNSNLSEIDFNLVRTVINDQKATMFMMTKRF